jgi:hypothetical protein
MVDPSWGASSEMRRSRLGTAILATFSKRFISLLQRACTYISRAFQRSADGVAEMIL